LWLVVPAAIQTTGWFHTNRNVLSPAAMAGMKLGVQMPAGIDGAVRMPTTTQDQTLCSRLQHTTGQLNHRRPARRCIISKNNTQTGVQALGEQITLRNDQHLSSHVSSLNQARSESSAAHL